MVQKREQPFKLSLPCCPAVVYLATFGQVQDEGHIGKIHQGGFAQAVYSLNDSYVHCRRRKMESIASSFLMSQK